MIVVNDKGREFCVRIVRSGDHYGLDYRLTHCEADPLIEFYDGPDERSQFVSRYYATTLASHVGSLCLDGGVPEWTIDGEAMCFVLALARDLAANISSEIDPNGEVFEGVFVEEEEGERSPFHFEEEGV